MSKFRQQIPDITGDLAVAPEGDLASWAIFTQLKDGAPHVCAGWLDAADAEMAVHFACEHYGQDQECVNIWAVPKTALAGTGEVANPADAAGAPRAWQVFTQKNRGDVFIAAETIEMTSAADAFDAARAKHGDALTCHGIWVAPVESIASTPPGEVIWRYTDQTYRLARGYSKEVREKWERIRAMRDLEAYEKDDLKETF